MPLCKQWQGSTLAWLTNRPQDMCCVPIWIPILQSTCTYIRSTITHMWHVKVLPCSHYVGVFLLPPLLLLLLFPLCPSYMAIFAQIRLFAWGVNNNATPRCWQSVGMESLPPITICSQCLIISWARDRPTYCASVCKVDHRTCDPCQGSTADVECYLIFKSYRDQDSDTYVEHHLFLTRFAFKSVLAFAH